MDVSRMHSIDRWVGTPICFLLTCVRKLLDRTTAHNSGKVKSILFVKLAEQGATILAYPAICSAVEMVGAENVYFLVFEDNRHILDVLEVVPPRNVIVIRTSGLASLFFSALRAIRKLRSLSIAAAVDLEFFARSTACLSYLSGARWRVGFHPFFGEASYRGDLLTHRVGFNPYLHVSQIFQLLVLAVKLPSSRLPAFDFCPELRDIALPAFEPTPKETEEVKSLLGETLSDYGTNPLILMNANLADLLPSRSWPKNRYVELAQRLIHAYPNVCIVFTGTPGERLATEKLVQQVGSKRCVSLAGRTTLRQLLTLYTLSEVLVTSDSGPSHFAALTSIDAITLFGPETPVLFGSTGPRAHVIWANLPCSPCVNAFNNRTPRCSRAICMQKISVDRVFQTVCEVFERRKEVMFG